jgi:hypothetical protein
LSRATGKLVTIQSVVASLSGPFGAGALSKMHRLKEILPDEMQKTFVNWLVCGDIIEVGKGQQIQVDCRTINIKSTRLSADQSVLTGESQPSAKEEHPVELKGVQLITREMIPGDPQRKELVLRQIQFGHEPKSTEKPRGLICRPRGQYRDLFLMLFDRPDFANDQLMTQIIIYSEQLRILTEHNQSTVLNFIVLYATELGGFPEIRKHKENIREVTIIPS